MHGTARRTALGLFTVGLVASTLVATRDACAGSAVWLLASDDGCPSRAGFAAALRVVVPEVGFVPDDREAALRVALSDAGAEYRVIAGNQERVLSDAALRCDERARK